jgi:putative transposase
MDNHSHLVVDSHGLTPAAFTPGLTPGALCRLASPVDWVLAQFSSEKERAENLYRGFVLQGIAEESPWKELKGQIFLGDTHFIEHVKTSLPDGPREVPRSQRFSARPSLAELFFGATPGDRAERNNTIHQANVEHGYTLKEIADRTGLHSATVSRTVKAVTGAAE